MLEEAGSWQDDTGRPNAGEAEERSHDSAGLPQGLAWSWEIDLEELLAAVTGPGGPDGSGDPDGSGGPGPGGAGQRAGDHEDHREDQDTNQDAELAAELDALEACPVRELSPAELAGRAAARMVPGPGLAALLAAPRPTDLSNYALPDAAAAWRRISSWAQAQELGCVAQMAARAAARDPKIGTGADGRPGQLTREACAEVSLALTLTGATAEWWTDLAVTLGWQLPATGAALSAGVIDLARARLVAEATCLLDEDTARAVEQKILPRAGEQTTGALRAALRRAVIAADPAGAERRRGEAERRARVVLSPEAESTATLAGQGLPGVHATAAMAKIQAMARALRAAGAAGSLDFLSAQVYIGLLLGTLPPIPPAEGARPDDPPPGDPPGDEPPGGGMPPEGEPHGREPHGREPHGREPHGGEPHGGEPHGGEPHGGDAAQDSEPAPGHCPDGDPASGGVPWPDRPAPGADQDDDPASGGPPAGQDDGPDGTDSDLDDAWPAAGAEPAWPDLPAGIPPGLTRPSTGQEDSARPGRGLLDLTVPWATLAGLASEPGWLGRLGPITAAQARQLARAAAGDPGTRWQIILTGPAGQARATAPIPRSRQGAGQHAGGHGVRIGLVSRVTLTMPDRLLDRAPPDPSDPPGSLGQILAAALRAATQAAARADADEAADTAAGDCAHPGATDAYRPPPWLRDLVTARDLTCRFPTCRQPAWRGDLDHTLAWDDGGRTCRCNLGGLCRTHHMIKQHPLWTLRQDSPGVFTWTTPAGRIYTATPDTHWV